MPDSPGWKEILTGGDNSYLYAQGGFCPLVTLTLIRVLWPSPKKWLIMKSVAHYKTCHPE